MTTRIAVLVFDGCVASAALGPLDLFSAANRLALLKSPGSPPPFLASLRSMNGQAMRASCGVSLAAERLSWPETDWLLVPALDVDGRGAFVQPLTALHEVIGSIAEAAQRRLPIATACSASFLLAETGALDRRRATTSWFLAGLFRRRYPKVRLLPDRILAQDGPFMTGGATTSYFDLSLRIVAKVAGAALAQATARVMLVDPKRQSQAPYVMSALLEQPRNGVAERAQRWLLRHLHEGFAVERLAQHCHVSVRTLLRRFHDGAGTTPMRYIQGLRVERAKALLETTHLSFEEIVGRCGYQDSSAFRKLFKATAQMTPREYQQRFRLRTR